MKGKIKFINTQKGWGFITGNDNKEVFFHVTDFVNHEGSSEIHADDVVEYEIGKSQRGNKAIKIKIIEKGGKNE